MAKKINSEFKIFNDENFTITMGTSNKKNPEVIYSIFSTYITPQTDEINEELFVEIEKVAKKNLRQLLSKERICEKDIIVVTDIAVSRMVCGKQTYLDIQFYFKPTIDILTAENRNFKNIASIVYHTYMETISKNIEDILVANNFSLSSFKNKTTHEAIY